MAVNARNGLLKLTSRWNNEAVLNPKEILIWQIARNNLNEFSDVD